jgi:hypothetical protein
MLQCRNVYWGVMAKLMVKEIAFSMVEYAAPSSGPSFYFPIFLSHLAFLVSKLCHFTKHSHHEFPYHITISGAPHAINLQSNGPNFM